MAIEVTTKDTTALSDAEVAEMADLCAAGESGLDVGLVSKQVEEWVLNTQAHDGDRLVGFAFVTLERIGGTPAVLLGLASIAAGPEQDQVLAGLLAEEYRRALLAFPDEDVLLGTRLLQPVGFQVFAGLQDVIPRPDHRATGEERAWGRRLAKRFGAEGRIDDRSFVLAGTGSPPPALDLPAGSASWSPDPELGALFAGVDPARGDCLVAFGWAMAEDLAAGKLPG